MAYQSEAELENLLIEQLKNQGYESANIQNYEELVAMLWNGLLKTIIKHFLPISPRIHSTRTTKIYQTASKEKRPNP